jgi:hypothetical protein
MSLNSPADVMTDGNRTMDFLIAVGPSLDAKLTQGTHATYIQYWAASRRLHCGCAPSKECEWPQFHAFASSNLRLSQAMEDVVEAFYPTPDWPDRDPRRRRRNAGGDTGTDAGGDTDRDTGGGTDADTGEYTNIDPFMVYKQRVVNAHDSVLDLLFEHIMVTAEVLVEKPEGTAKITRTLKQFHHMLVALCQQGHAWLATAQAVDAFIALVEKKDKENDLNSSTEPPVAVVAPIPS